MSTEYDKAEAERTRQELLAVRREYVRLQESMQLERAKSDAEIIALKTSLDSLQSASDSLTQQRNKESRLRSEMTKQLEDLRTENMKLRKELGATLNSKASHLRVPQVSFEQYRELVHVLETYQRLLSPEDAAKSISESAAVLNARSWVERMNDAPFAGSTPAAAVALGSPAAAAASSTVKPVHSSTSLSPLRQETRSPLRSTAGHSGIGSASVRESIVEGGKLVKISTDVSAPSGSNNINMAVAVSKQWSIENTTSDTQFIVEYTFGPLSKVEAIGDTVSDGRTFRLNLYPHETKPFVTGIINGYKMSVSYGPPDEGYTSPSSLTDSELVTLVERVRTVWRRSASGTDVSDIAALCLSEGTPFLDIDFPPLSAALLRPFELPNDEQPPLVHWLPPAKYLPEGVQPELCSSAMIPTALACGADFENGWLVSGMAALAEDPNVIGMMFSPTSAQDESAGLFSLWINKHGLWNIVCVDWYVPCREVAHTGPSPRRHRSRFATFGARSLPDGADLWPSILEKVFAKVHGSYLSLRHGDVLEALQDLTGFPTERFDWARDKDTAIFPALQRALGAANVHQGVSPHHNIAMLATSASAESDSKVIRSIGLRVHCAYRVLAAITVDQFRLVLIRCSLKHDTGRWTGDWSEGSDSWTRYPHVKKACSLAVVNIQDPASTMWMEWRDVSRYFAGCGICYGRPQWLDVRIPNRFNKTRPSWMLEVTVSQPVRMFIGIHQKDRRGLSSADADHLYGAFLITVVGCSSPSETWDVFAQSHGGTYWRGRDAFLDVKFTPSDKPYYVVPRRYSAEGVKDTILSLHIERRDVVRVTMREVSEEVLSSLRYSPLHKFDVSSCAAIPDIECQIDREPHHQLEW